MTPIISRIACGFKRETAAANAACFLAVNVCFSFYDGEDRHSIRLSYSYASLQDLKIGIKAAVSTYRRLMTQA
ncbi:hypothetical protein CTZ29_06200 [Bacillus halotolerans]|nr:hypothetical protein CTZ29_06200 [Bacillus halotolerans]